MKIISINSLYESIHKHLMVAQSYLEYKKISKVFKACRLKPYELMFQNRNKTVRLFKWWVDEFGNSVKILRGKILQIVYNDLHINQTTIDTDLYQGLPLQDILKISQSVFILAASDDELYQPCYMVCCYGIDGFFRNYLYLYGSWQMISPLYIPWEYLKLLLEHTKKNHTLYFEELHDLTFPCLNAKAWLTYLPLDTHLMSVFNNNYSELHSELTKEIKNNVR